MATIEVYREVTKPGIDNAAITVREEADYRWRLKADNGEIIASGEGFTTHHDARRGFGAVAVAVLELVTEDVKEGVASWR